MFGLYAVVWIVTQERLRDDPHKTLGENMTPVGKGDVATTSTKTLRRFDLYANKNIMV